MMETCVCCEGMELSFRPVFPAVVRVGRFADVSYALFPGEARREAQEEQLLSQFHFCGALSALVLRRFSDRGDVGMIAQIFTEGAAEDAHAGAVNDTDAWETGEEGAVEEPFDFGLSLISGASDHIDL